MSQKPVTQRAAAEKVVKNIRRARRGALIEVTTDTQAACYETRPGSDCEPAPR